MTRDKRRDGAGRTPKHVAGVREPMPDTREGRDKQANDEEKRQAERDMEEEAEQAEKDKEVQERRDEEEGDRQLGEDE